MQNEPDALLASPQLMRLLAHPLRLRIVGSLRIDGPATSAILARRLQTDSGQTSHHLRLLSRHAAVQEAPELGKGQRGRERWWKATHKSTLWTNLGVGNAEALMAVQRTARAFWDRTIETFFADVTRGRWSTEWQQTAASSDFVIRATPQRLEQLNAQIEQLVREFDLGDQTDAGASADTAKVLVVLHTYPFRTL